MASKGEIDLLWCISNLSQTMWNHTKNSMKELKQPASVFLFYNRRSVTNRSSLLKMRQTRETKMWITQNFEQVWPIKGRAMWKLTSWRFRKCGTFWVLKVLNKSYWLSKTVAQCAPQFLKNFFWTEGLQKNLFRGVETPKILPIFFCDVLIHIKNKFCKKKWVKTAIPALSSGQSNLHTPMWGPSRQLDDQYRNPNINNRDHLVGQLTRGL